jgi:hypothetical protein
MLNHQQYVNCRSNIAGALIFPIEWWQGIVFAAEAACAPLQKFEIRLSEIAFDHMVFELKQSLALDLYSVDGTWYCADEGQRFLARGDTMEQALHSFEEDFAVYWRVIVQAPDDELAQDAQEIKRFMRSIVSVAKKG